MKGQVKICFGLLKILVRYLKDKATLNESASTMEDLLK